MEIQETKGCLVRPGGPFLGGLIGYWNFSPQLASPIKLLQKDIVPGWKRFLITACFPGIPRGEGVAKK
jgi:hypothetical protein